MKQIQQSAVNSILKDATLQTMEQVRIRCSRKVCVEEINHFKLLCNGEVLPTFILDSEGEQVTIKLKVPFPFAEPVYVALNNEHCPVFINEVVRTKEFDSTFYYAANDLGVRYLKERSDFAVWTPVALRVELVLYRQWYDQTGEVLPLLRDRFGVWRITIDEDIRGYCYQYLLTHVDRTELVVDPYAKYLSINGQKAIIDQCDNHQPHIEVESLPKEQAIIYELHVRDFTKDQASGVRHKGKYQGLTEVNTTNPHGECTGLDYLAYLGVTHVQIMPVFKFANVEESNPDEAYNWGYDTTHFFALEGSYSDNPYSGVAQVKEFKELVNSFHKNGLRVIIDVVYNHLFQWENTSLEKLVPGYFFRYSEDGLISNGTGVGNDLASERRMVGKLLTDSVCYLISEFKVDGLRFDLMGIIDINTMKSIVHAVKLLKKDVLLLGEGWRMPTHHPTDQLATIKEAARLPAVSFFDDQFRDMVKGSIFTVNSKSFILSGVEPSSLKEIISGGPSRYVSPSQAIHYAEVHDNQTLWDHLIKRMELKNREEIESCHKLITSIVLLSQGIPFLHAGQEFCRTKFGHENSFQAPDWINQIDWSRRSEYSHFVNYVRGLIQIRRAQPVFTLPSFEEINRQLTWLITEPTYIVYQLQPNSVNKNQWKRILVIHNASRESRALHCEIEGLWQVCVDEKAASLVPLYSLRGEQIMVHPLSTMICYQ
ncbi:type I pullulanase [Alkalicoccobacillus porphyridii]|uniref:type I pullulanase n=1 Tax=Alkalicoccobacillus porphyridii TaxID=2597270 RepID=UPI00163DE254|nr:type I pullulanase [Alkalicoccobacillus porphyridii]